MKRLPRTLFRSLLKWNRQSELIGNPFVVLPSDYGIAELLPAGVTKLQGVEGVQAAIYHCFRHHPDTSENIDIAFNVMRKLNDRAVGLKKDLEVQKAHESVSGATYRLGQIVTHRTTKVRGVVIGWEHGETNQLVRILPDQWDCDERITSSAAKRWAQIPHLRFDEAYLKLVQDPQLQYIHNEQIGAYFSHLDPVEGVYVPLEHMAFQYPMDVAYQTYDSYFQSTYAEAALEVIDEQLSSLHKALLAALDDHFPGITSDPSAAADPLQRSRNDIARKILDDIILTLKALADAPPRSEFKTKLIRGERRRKMSKGRIGEPSVEIIRELDEELSSMKESYRRIGRAVEVNLSVERLAQLRFQTKGIAFLDTLIAADDNKSKLSSQMSSDVKEMILRTAEPAPVFTIGTIVRHKLHGYRGVVYGYDIRPVIDTTKWEGVEGLFLGQEQPFYRVVPDQWDISSWPKALQSDYYVPQHHLEEVKDMGSRIINHAHIGAHFEGYDIDQGRFRVSQQLKYSYPAGEHAFPADYPATSLLQRWDSMHAESEENKREEVLVFQTVDHLLVSMRAIIKESLRNMTLDRNALLDALREAPSKEWAVSVENLLWFSSVSSPCSDATACMRTGLAAFYRGNVNEASDAIDRAIAYDPEMLEAYNKKADLLMQAGEYESATEASTEAMHIHGDHFGGYYGLALAASKTGDDIEAASLLRRVLYFYPWADKVPSKLQVLLHKLEKEGKKERDWKDNSGEEEDFEDEEEDVK